MFDLGTSLLIAFAFAFGTFMIASNFFGKVWAWFACGIVALSLFLIALLLSLETLFIVLTVIFFLLLAITVFKLHLK